MAEVTLNYLFGHECKPNVLDANANSVFVRREKKKLVGILC